MKKIHILSYIFVLCLALTLFLPVSASALSDPQVSSRAALLIDTHTGNVLFEQNADERAYPASTTKIMTVLLAIEAVDAGLVSLDDQVTASQNIMQDLTDDGSTAGIVPGETMSFEDLIYCATISSANEACNIIAEHVSGDIASFVEKMNQRAEQLGCTGTKFTNTHGLPDEAHYTTARDLALVSQEAFSHSLFMEISNTIQKTVPATNVAEERILKNTNGLINKDSEIYGGYYYQYAKGIKTGHTNDAGYCLVSSAEKDGVSLLAVVLGGRSSSPDTRKNLTNFLDSITLYNWAFENFSYRNVLDTKDLIRDLPVEMGKDADFVSLSPQSPVTALMPNDADNSGFEQTVILYNEQTGEKLIAPVEAGTALGEISISRDGMVYGSAKLVAAYSVDLSYSLMIQSRIKETLKNPIVLTIIFVLLALLVLYIFLVVRYHRSRREYMQAMQKRQGARQTGKARVQSPRWQKAPAESGEKPIAPEENSVTPLSPRETELQAERDYFEEFFGKK